MLLFKSDSSEGDTDVSEVTCLLPFLNDLVACSSY